MTELPTKYDPAAIEKAVYQTWLDEKCFAANPAAQGEPYSIVIPPPNVTGALHLGHAINNTLQDILTRKARMEGKNAVWIPGLDHAGIATQAVVEKQLKEKENKTRHDVGREGLVERIWQWKQQFGDRILSQLQRLGCSCDWDRTHFTLDEQCARAVRETFFKLFKDGLVYRGKRLVNWDTHLQTSISDDEIYHEAVKTSLWHIRYEIVSDAAAERPSLLPPGEGEDEGRRLNAASTKQGAPTGFREDSARSAEQATSATPSGSPHPNLLPEGEGTGPSGGSRFMTVATTRPETLLGDTAVAVNSADDRWNWAIGLSVKLPLIGRLIPIIADDILVDPKFGTGVVKVTPAHDPNDYAVWQRHQGKSDAIDLINLMNPDGTLNAAAGERYAGLTMSKARDKVVADLEAAGLLEKVEPYETQVGHSDRSKTPIQPYLSDQWFVKMAPLAEPALEVVHNGTIQFFPERHKQQYLSWLGEKRDWPISRQLWWGHRIPVWRLVCDVRVVTTSQPIWDAGEVLGHLEEWLQETGLKDQVVVTSGAGDTINVLICARTVEADERLAELREITLAADRRRDEAYGEKYPIGPHLVQMISSLEQDPDVLDTWFSSALWPFSTLGWPEKSADLAKWYPTSVLMTGRDIITLWVARMVMMGMYNLGLKSHALPPLPQGEGWGEGRLAQGAPAQTSASSSASRALAGPHPNPLPGGEGTGGEGLAESINFGGEQYHDPVVSPPRAEGVAGDPAFHSPPDAGSIDLQRSLLTKLGVPFAHVAINPTILDGKGERMSKSKGNGVDPVDVIDTHGADALRFTLATMATETQDVRMPVKKDAEGRNTSDKFDAGRNFCNKLWNAARFAMGQVDPSRFAASGASVLGSGEGTLATLAANRDLTLADRWILSRFNRAIADANAAIASYRFDQYAKVCYDFVWRDFCDWYVEASKPVLKSAEAGPTAATLISMLDGALRLLHPVIPFITEAIWWQLDEQLPHRSSAGKRALRLMHAAWPAEGPVSEATESQFANLQTLVVAIRNARSEYNVDAKKSVPVTVVMPTGDVTIEPNRGLIESLANCSITSVTTTAPVASATAARVTAGVFEIVIDGLVDPNAERDRAAKRIAELEKTIASMEGRLNNAGYIAKAPPKLVEETKEQLAAAKAELAKLRIH